MIKVYDWIPKNSPLAFFTQEIFEMDEFKNIERVEKEGPINVKDFEKSFKQIHRWPIEKSDSVLGLFPKKTEKVLLTEAFDCLLPKSAGLNDIQFWPDLLVSNVLKKIIREKVKTLDLKGCSYVIGDSAWVRVLSGVAVQLGFSQINLVSNQAEKLEEHVKKLKRNFIGVQFEIIPSQELTLQPQNAGLVFNSINLSENKESLQDIAYFNFMLSEGLFVNLMADPGQKLLHDEVTRAQLQDIRAKDIELAWWREILNLSLA